MPRVAVQVAYDGTAFHGSQRQPGVRTVDGELLAALARVGAVEDPVGARYLPASRTDRGVSAAANVVAFDTDFRLRELPGAVNAHARDAWVHAVAPAPEGFDPRASALRRYRYFQPARGVSDADAFTGTLTAFEGTHDFTRFARVEEGQQPVRRVDAVRVTRRGGFLACDFEAPGFLWNQVRRMVGAALAVSHGDARVADVEAALGDPGAGRDFGLAPPEPLVLLEVRHDLPWTRDTPGARAAADALAARVDALALRLEVAGTLTDAAKGARGAP